MSIFLKLAVAAIAIATTLSVTQDSTARAGGGCHTGAAVGERVAAGTLVTMPGCAFGPVILETEAGATVRFENSGHAPHTVTGEDWGSYSELLTGGSFEQRFDSPGIYPYSCTLHPGMVGAIVVGGGSRDAAAEVSPAPATEEPGGNGPLDDRAAYVLTTAGGILGVLGLVAGATWHRRRAS